MTEGERMGTCRGSKTSVVTGLSFVLLISLSSVSPQEGRPMGSTGELLLPVWRSRAEGGRGGLHGHENATPFRTEGPTTMNENNFHIRAYHLNILEYKQQRNNLKSF